MWPVFGCAIATQQLTFDTDSAALSASTRARAAVECFQANRSYFTREVCSLSCLFKVLNLLKHAFIVSSVIIKSQRMPAILVEQCCHDWISGDVSWVHSCYGNRHGNSRQASGGDRLPENYAAISATNVRFPRNCLCSSDHFRFIIRTTWLKPPKPVRLLIRHYLLLSLHCILPLVSRYKR